MADTIINCLGLIWISSIIILLCVQFEFPEDNFKELEVTMVDELNFEWSQPFINKIYTVDENEKCRDSDEPLFLLLWQGAMHAC